MNQTEQTPRYLLQAGEFADLFCHEEIEVHIFQFWKYKFPTVSGFQNQTQEQHETAVKLFFFQEQAKQDQKAGTEKGHRDDTIIRTGIGRVHKPSSLFSDVWMCLWVFSRLYLPILQAFWHHF